MKLVAKGRRALLTRIGTLASGLFMLRNSNAAALMETPKSTEGPFYPSKAMRPADVDNDLVKVLGQVKEAGGEVMMLNGQIKDKAGEALEGIRVEIWQCDVNGKYLHSGDDREIIFDNGFQGFGHDITNADGEYSFRTIKPTKYPGRTPHIHVKVCKGDKELLTTQFYVKDEPDNNDDSIYRRLSDEQAASVSMEFDEDKNLPTATVNIVV